jgi:putative transcriptional regulator
LANLLDFDKICFRFIYKSSFMITIKPKKGHLLIAEPSIIGDTSFNRSVVLLADHTNEGSIGFILNKPLKYSLRDLVPDTEASFKVYNGGPVEQDNLYFIHKIPDLIPESIEISLGIYWGGDFDVVLTLINEGKIKSSDIRFFLGYSGWEPFQLEEELEINSWIVTENVYKKSVIEKKDSSFWKEKMLELGGDYSIWSNAPENPSYN